MYFRECPVCGANLDPGEACECVGGEETKERLSLYGRGEEDAKYS